MKLISKGNITVREDGLPYDLHRIGVGQYEFRATGNPAKPVVITVTNYTTGLMMLVAQAGN